MYLFLYLDELRFILKKWKNKVPLNKTDFIFANKKAMNPHIQNHFFNHEITQ